jgi:UDP-N-acetylmuramate dehydrogenase
MHFKTIDFSKFTSIKVGQPEEVLIIEKDDDLPKDRRLIGHGNNLLISSSPPPLMMLGKDFDFIRMEGNILTIGAATPTGKILSFAKKHDIAGFEFVSKLPGSMGGMLAMNAGVKEYEIFNILDSINIDGTWREKDSISHGYRFARLDGIALAANFIVNHGFDKELLDSLISLRSNQPKEPSAGSLFKNPPNDHAGRLIEAVGLKGKRIGSMGWSEVHANFLVNFGAGTFDEAIELINLAKEQVKTKFGIELRTEVEII